MNFIRAMLMLVGAATLLVLALPLAGAGLALLMAIGGLFLVFGWTIIWFLPFLLILISDKTTGGEKLACILAMIFLSWFAWIFYFLLAPLKPRARSYPY